ncbi:MAG: S1/P1 nuclease [Bryobacteraceae bacterium]
MQKLPMRPFFSLLLTYCLLSPFSAYGWWETGHQAVARIAAAHLTPAVRARIATLLGVPNTTETVADGLAKASTWADETKNETNTGAWHYIDLTLQDRKSDIPERCKDDNCAPARIRLFAAQLSSGTPNPPWSELDALRFVIHLVGDVHQPLHTISDADLGGNCELLDPPVGQAKNVHSLWDGEIVNEMEADSKTLAAHLEQDIPIQEIRRLSQGNQNDWVWESHELAEADIYRPLRIPTEPVMFPASCKDAPQAITDLKLHIGSAYVSEMKPVVGSQILKAGLRLARLLNESLANSSRTNS